jgi:hypothetical protein
VSRTGARLVNHLAPSNHPAICGTPVSDQLERVNKALWRVLLVVPLLLTMTNQWFSPTRADVSDALTTDRPYRKAMSPLEAKDVILKGRGTDVDPRVVDAFISTLRFGEMDVRTVAVA